MKNNNELWLEFFLSHLHDGPMVASVEPVGLPFNDTDPLPVLFFLELTEVLYAAICMQLMLGWFNF